MTELEKFFERQGVGKYRQWFREAVDASRRWQDEAREDYDFVEGRQWTLAELKRFREKRRPAITINRIRPLMNLLSGYQRLNRFDIEFAPRTKDDAEICQVRKGVTKYILDRCDYTSARRPVFNLRRPRSSQGGLFRAKWADKDELKAVYPEQADAIDAQLKSAAR